ncbi:MAG: hypothetical protein ACREDP_23405 [Bradyrhizobium sp.]
MPMIEQEIVISHSRWPVARAGMGLLLLPIGAVFCLLGYKIVDETLGDAALASILSAVALLVFGATFLSTLGRISISGGIITAMRAIDIVQFRATDILKARVFSNPLNHSTMAMIRLRDRRVPLFLHFVVLDHSNVGDHFHTTGRLKQMLGLKDH